MRTLPPLLLKELCQRRSAQLQTTIPSSSCLETRALTLENSRRLWVLTLSRDHLPPKELASRAEVSHRPYTYIQSDPSTNILKGRQDTTPTRWDIKYFKQTQAKVAPRNVYRFDSDVNLANPNTTCGEAYTEFADDKCKYTMISFFCKKGEY